LARLDVLKPGPYHLRLSPTASQRYAGSVYCGRGSAGLQERQVSLSGIVSIRLSVCPRGPAAAPARHRAGHAYHRTLLRHWRHRHGLLRIYQGAGEKLASVPLKITIQDAAGKPVFTQDETLAPTGSSDQHAADFQFQAAAGDAQEREYLLTVRDVIGKGTARRTSLFSVR
jgi:hypothetical protein